MVTFTNNPCIYSAMNQILLSSYKYVFACMLSVLVLTTWAQKPEVITLGKRKASSEEIITIVGSSFGTNAANMVVDFGAARGQIISISNTLMKVKVPAGATHQPVSVTNLTNGLTGYSKTPFVLNYSGAVPFDPTKLGSQQTFDGGTGLYDVCLCDFDNDTKTDVIAANQKSASITILKNTTAGPGPVSFTRTPLDISAASLHLTCGDLNGDGKKDLVVIDDLSTKIIILKNTSPGPGTISFEPPIIITLTNHEENSMPEIADLDQDGKPELIISDQGKDTNDPNGHFSVLKNISTTSDILFDTPLLIKVPGISTDDIIAADLNGDSRPEIITNQFQLATSNLYIFENLSTPGIISLAAPITLPIGSTVKRIQVGDLDGDEHPEIAVTQQTGPSVSIFHNTTAGSAISFALPISVTTDFTPWGIDMADLDGDGKTDIVTASLTSNKLTVLNNTSTTGSLSFVRHSVTTSTLKNQSVRLGDMDGDGKPDIVFTDAGSAVAPALPKVSVLRNAHCVMPVITPAEGTLSLCSSNLPFQLTATMSRGSYYQWLKDGSNIGTCTLNQNTLNVTTQGNYSVKILQEGSLCNAESNCALESAPINITTTTTASPGDPNPQSNGPVCVGSPLLLTLTDVGGGAQYKWRGPNNFTATGVAPSIASFQPENSGTYYVDVVLGTCIARTESVEVESIDIPSFQISTSGSSILCLSEPDKVLSVVPALSGFTYKWIKDGTTLITGPTTYNVTAVPASSGAYKVEASYSGCTTVETPVKEIYVSTMTPMAAFTVTPSTTACANQEITFNNQSSFDNNLTPVYLWTFGDGNTSTELSPKHIYTTDGTFNYSLKVSYADNTCPNTLSGSINITPAPALSITSPTNTYEICEGENLTLQVTGTFTDYLWSTGETTSSIQADDGGNYSVRVTSGSCVLTAYRTVTTKPAPTIIVSATSVKINEGETTQLTAIGVDTYTWSPADLVDDASSQNPIAGPLTQTTTFTVTGSDGGDCAGTGTIIIQVLGEAVVNKLKPGNFFSPDNQGTPESEFWQIENILDYPQCNIAIYDDKGVKVYESKPYLNDWDGTFNGKKLPDGVYFYIIRCEGEESSPRSGSITILRK